MHIRFLLPLVGATAALAAPLAQATPLPIDTRELSHLASTGSSNSSDACQALFNATVAPPTRVLSCLKSIPFNATLRDSVMDMADSIYTLDIFQYNQLGDSNPLLNQGVDIAAEFSRIRKASYSSDYEFQNDLSQVMNSLNDGHHAWTSCYRSFFSTVQQFPITALDVQNNGNVEIYLVPDLPIYAAASGYEELYASRGLNTTLLAGAQVLGINGQNAWDYLDNVLVKQVGSYQDPAQRFNEILASYQGQGGVFARFPGYFTSTQDLTNENLTMTVKATTGDQGTIQIPWVTRWSFPWNFTSGADFFQKTCLIQQTSSSSNSTTSAAVSASTTAVQTAAPSATASSTGSGNSSSSTSADILSDPIKIYQACPINPNSTGFPFAPQYNPQNSSAYIGGRDLQFYKLPNSTSGVMLVTTFELEDACLARFFVDAVLGLRNLTDAGVKHLLIDTSNNGGGSILLNQVLQRIMTGGQFIEQNNFQSVLRQSSLSQALAAAHRQKPNEDTDDDNFYAGKYRNGTAMLNGTTNLFQPGLTRQINGKTLYTSDLLQDSIATLQEYITANNISSNAPFSPENVVFTGNGLCGSACSSFTNFLIEYYNATAYIAAARPSQPIEFQGFAAGQASNADAVYSEAQEIGYSNATLLPKRLVKGIFGFAVRASISPNIAPGQFIQYRSYPAQNRFALTPETYSSPLAAWQYVASQVFGSK